MSPKKHCVNWLHNDSHAGLGFCVHWLHIKNHAVLGFTPDCVPCVMLKFDVKSFLISNTNNT